MAFIRGLTDAEATGPAREMFDADVRKDGYVWNLTRVFARRPQAFQAWRGLVTAIRSTMDFRRYELVTLGAARKLRGSYCMLAHGKATSEQLMPPAQVVALATDPATAGLSPQELAVVEFAARMAEDASRVTAADVERLRVVGLTDDEILDVALAAGARAFFCKVLDGLGVAPDAAYRSLDPALRDALTVGRPIDDGATP